MDTLLFAQDVLNCICGGKIFKYGTPFDSIVRLSVKLIETKKIVKEFKPMACLSCQSEKLDFLPVYSG